MNMIDMTDLYPQCQWNGFGEFSKNKWVKWVLRGKLYSEIDVNGLDERYRRFVLDGYKKYSQCFVQYVYVFNELLRDGMKVCCPSYEQCQILEHIELRLNIADYEQPYPIVLPQRYVDERKISNFVVTHKNKDNFLLMTGTNSRRIDRDFTTIMYGEHQLEELVIKGVEDDSNYRQTY